MPKGLNIPAGTVALEVAAELDKFERQMKKDVPKAAKKGGDKAGKEFSRSFSGRMKGFFAGVKKSLFSMQGLFTAVFAGLAVRVGKELFTIGSAIEETRSKFETVFGASSASVEAFIDDFGRLAGVTRNEGREILGTLGAVSQGLGLARDASAGFATEIFKLSADIGSFNNLPTEDVVQRITAALTGERESLKRLGIVVTEVEVQQRALLDTGKENVKAITQAEKATATLAIITEKAGVAVGDLARTQGSSANRARRVTATFRELRDAVAVGLLPAFDQMITKLDISGDQVAELTDDVSKLTAIFFQSGRAIGNVFTLVAAAIDGIIQAILGSLALAANAIIDIVNLLITQLNRVPGFEAPLLARFDAEGFVRRFTQAGKDIVQDTLDIVDAFKTMGTVATEGLEKTGTAAEMAAGSVGTLGTASKEASTGVDKLSKSIGEVAKQMNRLGATAPLPTRARLAENAAQVIRGLLNEGATEFALYQRVLDQLGVTLDELAEKYPILAREIEATTDQLKEAGERTDTLGDASGKLVDNLLTGARAAVNMASGLGVLGDSAALTLNQLVSLGEGIARIAAATTTGGIIGGAVAAGGALFGFIGGLFGGGPSPNQLRLAKEAEETADALRLLAESADKVASVFGNLPGDLIADFQGFVADVTKEVRAEITRRAEERGGPIPVEEAQAIFAEEFRKALATFGITLSDLEDIAAATGIDLSALTALLEGTGEATFEALKEFDDLKAALAELDFSRIFDSFSGQMRLLALEFDLLDITDAVDQLALLRETVAEFFGPELAARFEGLNLDEFEAELQAVFQEIKDGTFDISQLQGLTFDEFLAFLQQADGLIDQIGTTVAGLAAAIDELNADTSRLSFEFQVLGTKSADQFAKLAKELNEAFEQAGLGVSIGTQLGPGSRKDLQDLVKLLGEDLPEGMRSAILSLLRLVDEAASATAPRATRRVPTAARAEPERAQQDFFERAGTITEVTGSQMLDELSTISFLVGQEVAISAEQLRLMGGTPPPLGAGAFSPPLGPAAFLAPPPPPSHAGGGVFIDVDVSLGGVTFHPPDGFSLSDLSTFGPELDELARQIEVLIVERTRDGLAASGQTGNLVGR